MRAAVFDLGGTLMEYIGMPGNWTVFYEQGLPRFAVARMEREGISPITLRVADWNQAAVKLYEKKGFQILKTEVIQ